MKTEYTAIADDAGVYTLHKNGIAALCPKLMYPMPVPVKKPLGDVEMQMQLLRMPCSTVCPFAEIIETTADKIPDPAPTSFFYQISCEGGCKNLELTKPPVANTPTKSNLVKAAP